MMKVALLMLIVCLTATGAQAQTALKVPADASLERPFIKKDLPGPVVAEDRFFSVSVPKGWTVTSVGASERFLDDITITPTSDAKLDRTYLGLHTFRETGKKTVEVKHAEEKSKLKPNEKLGYGMWQGQTWLVKNPLSKRPVSVTGCLLGGMEL